jgi:hypothetical protein
MQYAAALFAWRSAMPSTPRRQQDEHSIRHERAPDGIQRATDIRVHEKAKEHLSTQSKKRILGGLLFRDQRRHRGRAFSGTALSAIAKRSLVRVQVRPPNFRSENQVRFYNLASRKAVYLGSTDRLWFGRFISQQRLGGATDRWCRTSRPDSQPLPLLLCRCCFC